MIRVGIYLDTRQVRKLLDEVKEMMLGEPMQREIMRIIRSEWIPNIQKRLENRKSRSGYRDELDKTMAELVGDKGGILPSRFYTMTELERRGPYARMGMTEVISEIIANPTLSIEDDGIVGYVGDIEQLNEATKLTQDHYLWEILEYGTGTYAGGSPIVREGFQVFFNRDPSDPDIVRTEITVNSGQEGRHYFMDVYGTFYASEIASGQKIIDKLNDAVNYFNRGGR